jgi:hypothetical protein
MNPALTASKHLIDFTVGSQFLYTGCNVESVMGWAHAFRDEELDNGQPGSHP